jgi:FixJ family two-component response regulator
LIRRDVEGFPHWPRRKSIQTRLCAGRFSIILYGLGKNEQLVNTAVPFGTAVGDGFTLSQDRRLITRRVREEGASARLLILTFHKDRAYVQQASQAGVRGHALKRAGPENLLQAIRAVHDGGLYVDPSVASRIFNNKDVPTGHNGEIQSGISLTDRETEFLKLAALGHTNKEIAAQLGSVSNQSKPVSREVPTRRVSRRVRILFILHRHKASQKAYSRRQA